MALGLVVLATLTLSTTVAGATITQIDATPIAHPVPHSLKTAQAKSACEADGATVETAMSAYVATNPGKVPTMAALVSSARGGPYI
jgi:hypothetical protein